VALVQAAESLEERSLLVDIRKNSYNERFVDDICPYIVWVSCNEIKAHGCAAARGEHDHLANFERVEQGDDVVAFLVDIQSAVRSACALQSATAVIANDPELLSKTPGDSSELEDARSGATDGEQGGPAANALVVEFRTVDCNSLRS
jgi:hypothetical protein